MPGRNRDILWLLALFAVVHLLLYRQFGVQTGLEATKYIQQAELMLRGEFPGAAKYWYYLPVILLIAGTQKLGLSFGAVVLAQTLVSAGALVLFYKGTKLLFARAAALIAGIALCVFLPFYSWDFYLYSESLFISGSLLLYYLVCRYEAQQRGTVAAIFAVLSVLLFTRPFGLLFVPPLFAYFLLSRYRRRADRWINVCAGAVFAVLLFVLVNRIFHGGEDMDAMKPFVEEHVVCFVAQKPGGAKLDLRYYDNGLRDIGYYIAHNPAHFARLMGQRLLSFFSMTRPWYSGAHNAAILAFVIPLYAFFFAGVLFSIRRWRNGCWYIVALVVLYGIGVTFQCDDWNGRFTIPIVGPIAAMAAFGAVETWKRLRRRTGRVS